jgi:hypothetical protein
MDKEHKDISLQKLAEYWSMIANESAHAIPKRFDTAEHTIGGCATIISIGIIAFVGQRLLGMNPVGSTSSPVLEISVQLVVSVIVSLALLFVWGLLYQPARLYDGIQVRLKTGEPLFVSEFNESQKVGISLKYPTR